MRRILICGGLHTLPKSLAWLRRVVMERHPDAIFFVGGVLDPVRHYSPQSNTDWGLPLTDARFIEHFFEELGSLEVFSAIIPGPVDTPLEDFLRIGMHAEIEFPEIHLVHATLEIKEDAAICGIGGPICDWTTVNRDTNSRAMIEYHLRSLFRAKQPFKILMLSALPTGDLGGDHGKSLVAELIDSLHPSLCVVGGPNEMRGSQRIANTLVVNPGHLADGSAVWLDRSRAPAEQVEFLTLLELDQVAVAADIGIGD